MSQPAMMTPAPPAGQPTRWKRILSLDNRFIPPTLHHAYSARGGISHSAFWKATRKRCWQLAQAFSRSWSWAASFFHKWPNLVSAYISGISIGILLRSPAFWALCAV